ncbi:MAG: putative bifunctional diguanylate cyclase/phosphodiesterase [Gaiellaceae bacterium]
MATSGGSAVRGWPTYVAVALAVGMGSAVVGNGSAAWRAAYVAVAVSGALAAATALRRDGFGWVLFVLAEVAFVTGDVLVHDARRLFGRPVTDPWLANLPSIAGYVFVVAAIAVFVDTRDRGRRRPALIDALIVAIPAAAAAWIYLMAPIAYRQTLSTSTKFITLAYPVFDLLLLVALVQFASAASLRRAPVFGLVLLGGIALGVGDVLHGWALLHPIPLSASVAREGGRIVFAVLIGAAALHPTAGELTKRGLESESRARPTPRRLVLLLVAACTAPVLMGAGVLASNGVVSLAAAVAAVLLLGLRLVDLAEGHNAAVERAAVLAHAGVGLFEARTVAEVTPVVQTAVRRLLGSSAAATIAGPDAEGADDEAITLPLRGKRENHGSLIIHCGDNVGTEQVASLSTLASSVALAIDSVKATEGLLKRRTDARFEALVQHSSDAILVLDRAGRIDYASPSTANVLKSSPDELGGRMFLELVADYDRPRVANTLDGRKDDSPSPPFEFELLTPLGALEVEAACTNLLYSADVRGIVVNIRDVSERKEFERQLAHRAFHDELTGLANRVLFRDRVEHALARVDRGSSLAVLFLDLDDFKTVNDTLGHQAGDELIRVIAGRLAGAARTADTAARLGGDEFAILMEDDANDASDLVAQRLLESIAAPIWIEDRAITMSTSIGIARALPGESLQVDTLLRNADVAMYEAKASGKGTCRHFSPEMHDALVDQLELKRELVTAIERGEFELRYQPVVDLATHQFVSLEALIRWNHPVRGFISPDEFIPIAEASGAIVPLGRWALRAACEQALRLQWRVGPSAPSISVNLSTRQLQEPTLVAETITILKETGLPPEKLVLEITETAMISDFDLVLSRLRDLRAANIRVAVDDFGSGYSSLNYIRRLPIDVLKIDRAFIADIGESSEVAALTETILALARIIGVVVVAEGIETDAQLAEVTRLGCDLGQGYLFLRPVDAAEIERVVVEQVANRSRAMATPATVTS